MYALTGERKLGAEATSKDESDSSDSGDSDASSESDDSSEDNDIPVSKSKAKRIEGLASGGQGRTRVNLQPKKSTESRKAQEFRDKRRKKEVRLNQLSSISGSFPNSPGGGISGAGKPPAFSMNCHNCGKQGHKAADCPQRGNGKRKSFQKS